MLQALPGHVEFACTRYSFDVCGAQAVVRWGALPFVGGFALIGIELGKILCQQREGGVDCFQACVDFVLPALAGRTACRVADELGAGLMPYAGQRAEPEAPGRRDPGLGGGIVLCAARHALEQSLHHGGIDPGRGVARRFRGA
ncbi:hypothetical protein RPSD_36750 (plasmid) [Ralstonia solanacearum]|nr:hypothetical protein RPSD_36750 [Ralstonia solanacearum]